MLVFEEKGKPQYPEKNLSEQRREPRTNSTHILRPVRESIPSHVGGRRVLSPLHHPCYQNEKDEKTFENILGKISFNLTEYITLLIGVHLVAQNVIEIKQARGKLSKIVTGSEGIGLNQQLTNLVIIGPPLQQLNQTIMFYVLFTWCL